jgi:hypothetical protein
MHDPLAALDELRHLADLPCAEWQQDAARPDIDCNDVAAAQGKLREALEAGGTHHDVLARVGQSVAPGSVPVRLRVAALAMTDHARAASLRRLALAIHGMGGPPAA